MNKEEKQAIDNLKFNTTNNGFSLYDGTTNIFNLKDIEIVLNLIDKLEKENKKLKKLCNKATEIIDEFADTLEEDNKKIHKYRMEKINNVGGDI